MPFTMAPERAKMRAEFGRDLMAELARIGPIGFRRHEMVARWAHGGAGRSTIWRWLREMLEDPDGAGQHFIRKPAPAVTQNGQSTGDAERAASNAVKIADEETAAASETQEQHARRASPVPDTRSSPAQRLVAGGVFNILEGLQGCITAATAVMERARAAINDQGSARTVIMASEHLRKSMETAIRLHDSIWNMQRIEQFHQEIIAAVEEESPIAAARIIAKLETIIDAWANPASWQGHS
jgi:hypothetical protein